MRSNESLQSSPLMDQKRTQPRPRNPRYSSTQDEKEDREPRRRTSLRHSFIFRAADCLRTHLSPSVPPQRMAPAINPNHEWWNNGVSAGGEAAASEPGGTAATTLSLAIASSLLLFAPELVLHSYLNSGPGALQAPALINNILKFSENPGGQGELPP